MAHAGGVVVDTSALRGVEVFAADGVARVGAGVKKSNAALKPHGL